MGQQARGPVGRGWRWEGLGKGQRAQGLPEGQWDSPGWGGVRGASPGSPSSGGASPELFLTPALSRQHHLSLRRVPLEPSWPHSPQGSSREMHRRRHLSAGGQCGAVLEEGTWAA